MVYVLFLRDSAYPATTWLLTPYANPDDDYEKKFNHVHKTLRVKIENSFGLLKGQWRRLWNLNVNSIEKTDKIIESESFLLALVVVTTNKLHNRELTGLS